MGLLNGLDPHAGTAKLNLFSSHSWKYGYHREGLHDLLSKQWIKGVDYLDSSIPESHPEDAECDRELMEILRRRIEWCDVFLVFGNMYVDRPWIRDEITTAFALQKPILAIRYHHQERLSKVATRFATEEVYWRGDLLREAILRHAPPYKAIEVHKRVFERQRRARQEEQQMENLRFARAFSTGSQAIPPYPTSAPFNAFNEPDRPISLIDLLDSVGRIRKS